MSAKPAESSPLAFLIMGLISLVIAAQYTPEAARELIKFPFNRVLLDGFDQLFNTFSAAAFLVLGIYLIRSYFRFRAVAAQRTKSLTPASSPMAGVRQKIDDLDDQIVALLARRQRQIEVAAKVKQNNTIPARVPERVGEVLDRVTARAKKKHLDPELARSLWSALIEWSIAYEERLMKSSGEKQDPA